MLSSIGTQKFSFYDMWPFLTNRFCCFCSLFLGYALTYVELVSSTACSLRGWACASFHSFEISSHNCPSGLHTFKLLAFYSLVAIFCSPGLTRCQYFPPQGGTYLSGWLLSGLYHCCPLQSPLFCVVSIWLPALPGPLELVLLVLDIHFSISM